MTIYRITPDGFRRRIGDGDAVRAVGVSGDAYTALFPAAGTWGMSGSAALTSTEAGALFPVAGGWGWAGAASLSADARMAPVAGTWGWAGAASIVGIRTLTAQPGAWGFAGSTHAVIVALLHPVPGQWGWAGSATLNASARTKMLNIWLRVLAARQSLLNAIDAHNRNLALAAGDAATANAQAIIATNTRVAEVEDGIEAEASRITLMQTSLTNTQQQLTATSNSLTATQSTVAQHGNTLTAQGQQISQVSASVTTLDGKVTNLGTVTTQMQASVDSLGAAKLLHGVYLNANGYISGYESINNGVTSQFNVLASVFRLLSPGAASGLEVQNGYVRTWGSGFQFVIGSGFGASGDLAAWFGPNIGVAACTIDNAISCSTTAGYQQTSGVIKGGLLSASAMQLGSTRIHTGGGRLAPFSVQDMSFSSINGSGWQNFTQTVDGFVGPNNGSGYHAKRFAAQRMDVFIDVLCAGSRNSETLILEVQYDGGSWSTITSVNMDVSNKAMIPLMIRYTTLDTWNTVAFRACTTQGNSQALSIKVSVWNYNESGNAAGSNSGTTGSSSSSGSLPPGNGGGGGGGTYCVDWDTILPDGRFARDLRVGDLVECVDVPTGTREWIALRAIAFGEADCYAVRTAHGEVIQSDTTPMVMRDGSIVLTPDLDDRELLTHAHGFERARIEHIGRRKVVKVDFGNRMFFAGTRPDNAIATHNIKMTEPP